MKNDPKEIRFFNTLTGRLDEFHPLRGTEARPGVGMYTCGPTVYDYAHIGNFRAFVFEDLLRRFLEAREFEVRHVMNLTDVDDKTIAGAAREGKTLDDFTAAYIKAFHEDLKTLNILSPNYPAEQPRATREIPDMIRLIEGLVRKGVAYESDGSVYYRVSAFPGYGKLSKKKLEMNREGARVDADEYDKEQGADFVLWKKSKEGEPFWDSPWGKGRPGWHIECSAMSMKYLGETFDIHAGGEDLIFPHHENEIAQSEAVTGKPFVRYWLHCKFLLVNGEKMSKSKGNFYTLRDLLLKGHDPMAIRYLLLSTHYRSPLNFTLEGLEEARQTVERLDECYWRTLSLSAGMDKVARALTKPPKSAAAEDLPEVLETFYRGMLAALAEDLNISATLALLLNGVVEINRNLANWKIDSDYLFSALKFFKNIDRVLGLDVTRFEEIPAEVARLTEERINARHAKDFKKSDELRKQIEALGWLVKDGKPGEASTVKKKRRVWDK